MKFLFFNNKNKGVVIDNTFKPMILRCYVKFLCYITRRQQKNLLDFVGESAVYNVYLPLLQIMIETSFRCGEIIGLTWSDVDMKKKVISINHQLVYKDFGDGNGYCFHITTPKTEAGIRRFPMTDNIYKAFEKQRKQNFMLSPWDC